ncbi:MAG: tyrosine-type recombinase/integrase [Gammaproteobacteria bacterium]
MSTSITNLEKISSKQEWKEIPLGSDIGRNGLYKRKLSDGTGSWRYDFYHEGKHYKGVLGRERDGWTLTAARERLDKLKAEVILGVHHNLNSNQPVYKSFRTVAEAYLEWAKSTKLSWEHDSWRTRKHLLPYFGNRDIASITTGDVEKLKQDLLIKSLDGSTVNRVVALLSSIFNFERKHNSTLKNPIRGEVKKLREPIKETIPLDEAELTKLLKTASNNQRNHVLIALAIFAGLRASEVLGLEWKRVDFKEKELHICQTAVKTNVRDTTKSGKKRIVPISAQLHAILLQHYHNKDTSGFVIKSYTGERLHKVQDIFSKMRLESGIRREVTFHTLRHTFATNAANKGVNLPTLQQWMGHSDIKTTMRYIYVDKEHSQQMMELLDAA